MPQARTVNRSHRPDIAVAAGWPLARRVGLDGLAPGGRLLSERLIRGAGIRTGDRVVDLLPGDGALGRLATRHDLHSWTGVCLDRTAAKHVRKRVAGGGTILGAPDRTGLDDGSATVVVAEGLLSGLSAPSKRAVLDEARRILRPGGRIGISFWGHGHLDLRPCFQAFVEHAPPERVAGMKRTNGIARPGVAESMLESVGFEVVERGGRMSTLEWPDADTAWRAMASVGPAVPALERVGPDVLRPIVMERLDALRDAQGIYRFRNDHQFVIARRPS